MAVGQPQLIVDPGSNRISSAGFGYDASGNLKLDPNGSYIFDADNRMTQSVVGGTTAAYGYDGNRLRVQKTVGATTTTYVFSGAKVIAEYSNGALSKESVYSGSRLLATVAAGVVTYHHPDHLSNRLETNSAGTVTRSFGQLPFGDTWYETGTADKWKFTTYERDPESGLDYATERYYSSGYGRFTAADLLAGHLANPQSLNRYTYVTNDPVNFVDPLGLDEVPCTMANGCYIVFTWDTPLYGNGGSVAGVGGGFGGAGEEGKPLVFIGGGRRSGGNGPVGKARRAVDDILKGNGECAKFFNQGASSFLGGASSQTAADLFDSDNINVESGKATTITKSADGSLTQPYAARTSEGTGANSDIILNSNGAFFNSSAFIVNASGQITGQTGRLTFGGTADPFAYGGNTLAAQAGILLHEFAHTINLIPSDSSSPDQSTKNSQTILDKCKHQIDNLKK